MNSVTNSVLAHWRQVALFLAGGVATALLDVGLMQLLIAGGMHYTAATTAGFGAALLVNYSYHSRITFVTAATPVNFARYLGVVGLNYLVTIGCVALAVALGAGTLAGKLVSLPLVAVNSFLLGKYWIFK
jgi:putative flippase GtrA